MNKCMNTAEGQREIRCGVVFQENKGEGNTTVGHIAFHLVAAPNELEERQSRLL